MSGNLAYEFRGPLEEGPAIYDAVFAAGKDLGIQRLGWATYLVNHVEGGFPQMTGSSRAPPTSSRATPFLEQIGFRAGVQRVGSVDPTTSARACAPRRGRLAARGQVRPRLHRACGARGRGRRSEADRRDPAAGIPRTSSTSTHRCCSPARSTRPSTCRRRRPGARAELHADHLLKEGRRIGVSSGTIYSYHYREVLSMGHRRRPGRDRQRGRRPVGRSRRADQGRPRDGRALPLPADPRTATSTPRRSERQKSLVAASVYAVLAPVFPRRSVSAVDGLIDIVGADAGADG